MSSAPLVLVLTAAAACASLGDGEPMVVRRGDVVRIVTSQASTPIVGRFERVWEGRVFLQDLEGNDLVLARSLVQRVHLDLRAPNARRSLVDCRTVRRRRGDAIEPVGVCAQGPHWFPAELPVEDI